MKRPDKTKTSYLMQERVSILIIDDNEADANYLTRLLQQIPGWDVQCHVCTESEQAQEKMKSVSAEIVFVDYLLGAENGVEVILRLQEAIGNVGYVLLTGQGDEQVAIEAIRAGAQDYLTKASLSVEILDRCLRYVRGHLLDIKEVQRYQNYLEEVVEARTRELYNEKEQLQVTLSSIHDAVLTTDMEGLVQSMNPAALQLVGCTIAKAQNRPLNSLCQILHENSREVIDSPALQTIQSGEVIDRDDAILIDNNGKEVFVEVSAAPLQDRSGNIMGSVLVLRNVTQARLLSRQMDHQAKHDALTGLINRSEFEVRLKRALGVAKNQGVQHILLYLDLDQFKVVNDTCGHVAGDAMLREIANIIRSDMRQRDTLARLGGDEFGIILEFCSVNRASQIAEDLKYAIQTFRFGWEGKVFSVSVSIGLVSITQSSRSLESLLSNVDAACYAAKDRGRNRIHVYDENDDAMQQRQEDMEWVARICHALEEDRMELVFQDIVSTDPEKQEGRHGEVLLRMKDENDELIPPDAFLPAAERYNLTPRIDRWVINTLFQWLDTHREMLSNLQLCSVNLSGHSIVDDQFFEFLEHEFDKYHIDANKICFEVTETSAIANLKKANDFIKAFKKRGCYFAIDDFGTGFSTYAYLKNLSVDFIKIDGLFITDIVDNPINLAMVESINQISHLMGVKTIAEFVENKEILNKIREIGVDYAQGYAIGKPMPLNNLL